MGSQNPSGVNGIILFLSRNLFRGRLSSIPPFPPTSSHYIYYKMLRRQPTQIALTSEDIAAYDDSRLQRAARIQHQQQQQLQENLNSNQNGTAVSNSPGKDGKKDPNDELKPLPGGAKNATAGRSGADLAREREQRIMGR